MKTKRSFTLIELLIASSIFVVVMVSIYSAFHAGVFGFRDIENNIDVYQTARRIMERLDQDLRNAFYFQEGESRFEGTTNSLSFFTLVDAYHKDNESTTQDYAFVSYELQADKLMRRCRRNKESLNTESKIEAQEFASGVEITFQYAQITSDQSIKWLDTWGPQYDATQKTFPAAVKVTLTFKDKINKDFERTIYLPMAE